MSRFRILEESTPEDSFFDRQERIGWWKQSALSEARVLVAGAGALGNETIKNLALLGVRKFLICDFDEISTSNLSRTVLFSAADIGKRKAAVAAERCKDLILSEDPEVEWLDCDLCWELGLGRVAECSIVLSCLDNIEARKSLAWAARKVSVPFIDGGISELLGHIGVYPVGAEACYSCNLSATQQHAARRRYSCDDVKRKSFVDDKVPTVQIASAIISAIQCQEAVKLLMGELPPQAYRLTYNGMTNAMDRFALLPSDSCAELFHDAMAFEDCEVHARMPLQEALDLFARQFGGDVCIDLSGDRSITTRVLCRNCRKALVVNKPTFKLTEDDLFCAVPSICRSWGAELPENIATEKEHIARLSYSESDLLPVSLLDLGIPERHIISIEQGGRYRSVRLKG